MDDRQLLELAAKAAGYLPDGPFGKGILCLVGEHAFPFSPLSDDGDALRLSVKLQLSIGNEHISAGTAYCFRSDDDNCSFPEARSGSTGIEILDSDYAATRRAIVLAAAEIGKGM